MSKLTKKTSSSATSAKMRRKVQSQRRDQRAESRVHHASVEDQIAALEEQIALLREEGTGSRGEKVQRAEFQCHQRKSAVQSEESNGNISAPYTLNSALDRATQLAAPVIQSVTATADTFTVAWASVPNAYTYSLKFTTDPTFASDVLSATSALTTVTISDRSPETTYYVRVIANPPVTGDYSASNFSAIQVVRTLSLLPGGELPEGNTASFLQAWLSQQQILLQNASSLVPEIESTVLTPGERRRLLGSGVRRYGYVDKVSDASVAYPQFWPDYASNGEEQLKGIIREIEVLRNLLVFFESGARTMQDLLLIKGNEALRLANIYYSTVREAARRSVPDAEALFRLLNLFWRRPRRMSQEPTERQTMRNFKGLMRGTREGEMFIENERDSVVKGKRTVVDNTRKKPRNNFKEIETAKVDLSADCADECR
jgi:hypothetical protein